MFTISVFKAFMEKKEEKIPHTHSVVIHRNIPFEITKLFLNRDVSYLHQSLYSNR